MTRSAVAVRKTRVMVATEVAAAVGAGRWERDELSRLTWPTLVRLAEGTVPGFRSVIQQS